MGVLHVLVVISIIHSVYAYLKSEGYLIFMLTEPQWLYTRSWKLYCVTVMFTDMEHRDENRAAETNLWFICNCQGRVPGVGREKDLLPNSRLTTSEALFEKNKTINRKLGDVARMVREKSGSVVLQNTRKRICREKGIAHFKIEILGIFAVEL